MIERRRRSRFRILHMKVTDFLLTFIFGRRPAPSPAAAQARLDVNGHPLSPHALRNLGIKRD